jgi:hypothetical protein
LAEAKRVGISLNLRLKIQNTLLDILLGMPLGAIGSATKSPLIEFWLDALIRVGWQELLSYL